jgi:hypothetical protein
MEFRSWGKTPRLFRDIVITEKIDGSNSAIIFEELDVEDSGEFTIATVERDGVIYAVGAQSKNRLITPGKTTDNYGFAAFVQKNTEALFDLLGVGHHFGEWYGEGIQRRYGDANKGIRTFALFNTAKHKDTFGSFEDEAGRHVLVESVPIIYEGPFSEDVIRKAIQELGMNGSIAVPFHPNPEGIVVYHTQSKQVYKVTRDNNDKGKWEL